MANKIIYFVTGNEKKVQEIQAIINENLQNEKLNFIIKSHKLDLPELQGEPEYIALEKCRLASLEIDGACIIEDTSLCYNALGGLPGPYIKWFLDKTGLNGLNNILSEYEDKSAYAQTIFAYTKGKGEPIQLFNGRIDGNIVPARGSLGFGWDPIFQPNGEYNNQTFGEMDPYKKNSISHRYLALCKLKDYFINLV